MTSYGACNHWFYECYELEDKKQLGNQSLMGVHKWLGNHTTHYNTAYYVGACLGNFVTRITPAIVTVKPSTNTLLTTLEIVRFKKRDDLCEPAIIRPALS